MVRNTRPVRLTQPSCTLLRLAGGLTLLTAAIILWNTVYLERAVQAQKSRLPGGRHPAAAPLTPGMGTYQSDGGLCLAEEPGEQNRVPGRFM